MPSRCGAEHSPAVCGVVAGDVAHAVTAGRRALDQFLAVATAAAGSGVRTHAVAGEEANLITIPDTTQPSASTSLSVEMMCILWHRNKVTQSVRHYDNT